MPDVNEFLNNAIKDTENLNKGEVFLRQGDYKINVTK